MSMVISVRLRNSALVVPNRPNLPTRDFSPARLGHFGLQQPFSSGNPIFAPLRSNRSVLLGCRASKNNLSSPAKPEVPSESKSGSSTHKAEEEEEEYEEVSWLTDKIETSKEFTASVIQRVPGPRVGGSGLPWLVALPAFYFSVTFIIAVIRTILKWRTPKAKRRRLIGKNAVLVESLDEIYASGRQKLTAAELRKLQGKCGFDSDEVFRKYIRYALNEKPFDPSLVADLIHLRQTSGLPDPQVVEIMNDIARRTVKAKGAVMMDTRGLTEKGIQRKAVVQSIFTKLLYLTELEEFLSPESRKDLEIKSIFGVTDEDADEIRIQSLSQVSDVDSLEEILSSEKGDEKDL